MKKVIVTGGAGFIGSALIRYLIRATDCEVLNLDKLTYAGNTESLREIADSPRYHFCQMDICDPAVANVFDEFQPSWFSRYAYGCKQ